MEVTSIILQENSMPIGIVSEEDYIKEKENLVDKVVPVVGSVVTIHKGRPENSGNVPEGVRKIIGEVGLTDRQGALTLAASLGVGASSASAYANGATSTTTYHDKDSRLGGHIDRVRNRIVKKAKNRLLDALDSITEDKLANAELRDASSVAKDMSVIIKNMEPEASPKDNKGQQNNFVIFAPMVKSEESFETIYARE